MNKTGKVRVVKINGHFIIAAAKDQSLRDISRQFERRKRIDVDEIVPVSLLDKHRSGRTFQEVINSKEFTEADLPINL